MIKYDKYGKLQKVVIEVKFLRSPKNVQLLRHTEPDVGTLA